MTDASVFPTSFPTQTVLQPLLNIKGASDAVTINTRGPANAAPQKYVADSWSDTQIMFQNIVPPNTRTCIEKSLLLTYKVQIAYTFAARISQITAGQGLPFLGGVDLSEYLQYVGAAPGDTFTLPHGDFVSVRSDAQERAPSLQFRSLPLNHVCNNLDVKINGQSTSINPSDFADIYPYVSDPAGNGLYNSTCPVYQDTGLVPVCTFGGPFSPSGGSSQMRADTMDYRGTLSPYNAVEARVLAFAVAPVTATNAGVPAAQKSPPGVANGAVMGFNVVYEVTITEPLIIPPFSTGEVFTEAGLTRVMTLSLNANLGSLMRLLKIDPSINVQAGPPVAGQLDTDDHTVKNRLFNFRISISQGLSLPAISFAAGAAPGGGGAALTTTIPAIAQQAAPEAPYLTIFYASLDPATADGEPAVVVYESDLMQQWSSPLVVNMPATPAAGYVAAQTKWSGTSQALRLPSMPELIYVYARPAKTVLADGTKSYRFNDFFLSIDSVQVSFMDRTGLLTTYDKRALYRMCVKNGYRGSYKQWYSASGSILIINVAEDLCLSPTEAPGQNVYSTFQITVNGSLANVQYTFSLLTSQYLGQANDNLTGGDNILQALPFELVVSTVIPGKCAIGAGQATFMTEGPSPATLFEETRAGITTDTHDVGKTSGASLSGGAVQSKPGWLKRTTSFLKKAGRFGLSQMKNIPPELIQSIVGKVVDAVQPSLGADDDETPTATGEGFRRRKRHY